VWTVAVASARSATRSTRSGAATTGRFTTRAPRARTARGRRPGTRSGRGGS
jgi:hypothetical protein